MNKVSIPKLYVYIALTFGILFLFLTPPFQSPDEGSHFVKSYLISKGKFYPTIKNNKYGNDLPIEMKSYINEKSTYIGDRDKKYSFTQMVADQYDTMDYHKNKFYTYSTSTILPIVYIAPAGGIIFSKIIAKVFFMENISTTYMLYFARIFSLLFSIFIIYHAIKKTPVLKKTMMCVALIPMTTFLISVVSYDSILISLSLYTIATILKLIYDKDEKLDWKNIIKLGLIGVVLLNVKTVYFIILSLMILIPKEKYGNKKEMIKKILILIIIIMGATFILKLPFTWIGKINEPGNLASKQISFIINNPIKYTGILISNIIKQRNFQLNGIVGMFGLIDTYLPLVIVALELIFLILMPLTEEINKKIKISMKMKIILLLIILGVTSMVYTGMYISWTPKIIKNAIGGSTISGVQGRYFIPIVFPFLMLFSNKLPKNNKFFNIVQENYLLIPLITLIFSTFTLVLRYWA